MSLIQRLQAARWIGGNLCDRSMRSRTETTRFDSSDRAGFARWEDTLTPFPSRPIVRETEVERAALPSHLITEDKSTFAGIRINTGSLILPGRQDQLFSTGN